MTHSSQVGVLRNRHYSLMSERWLLVAPPRHAIGAVNGIVRASLCRNTIEPIHDVANGGIPSYIDAGVLVDTWLLYSEATRGRRRTDNRQDGHLLTLRAFLPARAIQHGFVDESYSSRGTTVIVMRGTYLYRKRVLFHWSRHNMYKGPTARCRALRARSALLYFLLPRLVTGAVAPEALQNAISGLDCRNDFSYEQEARVAKHAGVQCAFGRHRSAAARAQRKGVVSISDAEWLPRN